MGIRAPRTAPVRYAIAVGAAAAMVALRAALAPLLGDELPFLTLISAVVVSAWAGGFWPSMLTTGLCAATAAFLWLPPLHTFRIRELSDLVALLLFITIGTLVSTLSETMLRGRRRFESLLQSLDEGFVVFDRSWRSVYVNGKAAELLQPTVPTILGKTIWEVFPDIVGTEVETRLRRAYEERTPVEFETRSSSDGRWFRNRVLPTPDGVSIFFEDVTERKRAEEDSLRLAAIVRSADEVIVGKDLNGIVTSWNPAAERLFGFTAQETIGRSIRIIVPADRQAEEDEVLSRLRRGETIEPFETVRVRKDGTPIDVAVTVSPIKDAAGRIVGASKIARDIGGRLRGEAERARLLAAEQAARARAELAERRATLLSEASAALSSSLDAVTALRSVSRLVVPTFADWCIVDLMTRENALERVVVVAADPDAGALLAELQRYVPDWASSQPAAQALRARKTLVIPEITEDTLVSTTRDERHLALMRQLRPRSAVTVPMTARQRIVGVITLVRTTPGHPYDAGDVAMAEELARRAALAVDNAALYTDAEQARTQAEEANRAKDQFLAMLGHELRNPLGAISVASSVLGQAPTPEQDSRARDVIIRQTEHLTRLVDDLLDVTRGALGKIELVRTEMDMAEVVRRCIATLDGGGKLDHHVVTVDAEPAWVAADAARIEQIVTNLLSNSLKFTPRGGAIRVTVRRERDEAVLRVADDGAGISAELLPFVFDLFVQGDRGLDRRSGGLGVGLTLVRRLVELHGGRVEAVSAGHGRGSEFTVRLPLVAEAAQARGRPVEAARGAAPKRILVVEDNVDNREMTRILLETFGHEIHEAEDGVSAVELAVRLEPDVVLIDIGLPGIDGYEVARQIRSKLRDRSRLIALSGYGQQKDRQQAFEAGFDEHLLKPVDPERLVAILGEPRASGRS